MPLTLKSKTAKTTTTPARTRGTKATTAKTTRTRGATNGKTATAKKTAPAKATEPTTPRGNSGPRNPVPEGMTQAQMNKLVGQFKKQREKQDAQAEKLKTIQSESHDMVANALRDGVSMAIIHREFGYSRQFMYKLMKQYGIPTGGSRKTTTKKTPAKTTTKKAPARKPAAKAKPAAAKKTTTAKAKPAARKGGLKLKSR